MGRKKRARKSNLGPEKEPRPWLPTRRQVLWAVGTLFTLVTIALLVALLVVNLDAVKWENLSRERIEQVALFIGIAVAVTTLIFLLAIGGASLGWTGFADKTLWEWLQLLSALAIPLVLAIAGFWFTTQQEERQQRIETQRAESERQLEEQRAQDDALQAYLDQMTQLILDKDLHGTGEDSTEARSLARARTLTVLERLDSSRKSQVMQFLSEANLVGVEATDEGDPKEPEPQPAIRLDGANLRDTNLFNANLILADLSVADLRNTDLRSAHLGSAFLVGADLRGANLRDADLSFADLSVADLREANLRSADLRGANLSGADLSSADLFAADGVRNYQLDQARSLAGATMSDGPIHAGRYVSTEFEPALSFTISDGWRLAEQNTIDKLSFEGPEGGQLIFQTSPLHVFDPTNPSAPKQVPAPENADEWASWFQRHPNLDASTPAPVSVGGASGVRIDVTGTSAPDNYPRDYCGTQPCVPLVPQSGYSATVSYAEWKARFVIVDVENETVLIDVAAPADKFDEFLPKAQKVLDTVAWKGG